VSAHGRRRPGPEPSPVLGPAHIGWALVVIAAALIGGLAAAALVHASLVVAVIVSVVIGVIGVLVLLRSPARSPELTVSHQATVPRTQPPRAAPPPESYPPDPVAPATPAPSAAGPGNPGPDGLNRGGAPAVNETVVQLLPLTPPGTAGPADAPWWDSAQGKPAPSAGAKRAPAPDLSTYLGSTFIAQCPRCGAFRLDIRRARSAWDFRCEVCEYTWSWQPGTPWPPVRVMPP
jgi:hypothetical protein